ncbi:glycosyltransferase [Pseudodesulfovibrio cashew]|uniref:Glycosyltransferase n=1 Tax=Pseudodesulfovibrio cashew TaxID=2678688 RepID=A0A6I6JHD1_9BACT|nr:glycosyltransferase family 4 protein [Pseudodesulfovibrio cashew]QGY39487.1 glycosyltransferase [Pseudodesulfovibrio cashew]
MKIAFCTPFKPIDHASVSGDVTIARDLAAALAGFGHEVLPLPYFPAKEIYRKPTTWPGAWRALNRMADAARGADCWLTYGSYYKVPDVFGPTITRRLAMPYVIFQASYAENRGRRLATWPGYALNKRAMLASDHIVCNRVNDMRGCAKLLPEDRYTYVRPGLPEGLFARDEAARERLRREWSADGVPVIVTAAIMRHGVKAEGLRWVVETCAELAARGRDFRLVVAGGGPRRDEIEALARERLGERVTFLGLVDRTELAGLFSAGDLFAFPGLEESVGMVYLEAQRCGLPVVATDDEGAPHVIRHEVSGLITPVDRRAFTEAVDRLLTDSALLERLGAQAAPYVRDNHTSATAYAPLNEIITRLVRERKQS